MRLSRSPFILGTLNQSPPVPRAASERLPNFDNCFFAGLYPNLLLLVFLSKGMDFKDWLKLQAVG